LVRDFPFTKGEIISITILGIFCTNVFLLPSEVKMADSQAEKFQRHGVSSGQIGIYAYRFSHDCDESID